MRSPTFGAIRSSFYLGKRSRRPSPAASTCKPASASPSSLDSVLRKSLRQLSLRRPFSSATDCTCSFRCSRSQCSSKAWGFWPHLRRACKSARCSSRASSRRGCTAWSSHTSRVARPPSRCSPSSPYASSMRATPAAAQAASLSPSVATLGGCPSSSGRSHGCPPPSSSCSPTAPLARARATSPQGASVVQ